MSNKQATNINSKCSWSFRLNENIHVAFLWIRFTLFLFVFYCQHFNASIHSVQELQHKLHENFLPFPIERLLNVHTAHSRTEITAMQNGIESNVSFWTWSYSNCYKLLTSNLIKLICWHIHPLHPYKWLSLFRLKILKIKSITSREMLREPKRFEQKSPKGAPITV